MINDDEAEFASLFQSQRYGKTADSTGRLKAERQAALTDKQFERVRRRARGATRSDQMGFRCTTAFRKLSAGLAKHMSAEAGKTVSIADMMEEAVALLAKKKGYKGDGNA